MRLRVSFTLVVLLSAACGGASGSVADERFEPSEPASATGGSGGSAGGSGGPQISTSGGAAGAPSGSTCTTGEVQACYSGPAGTEGVGACQAGSRTCVSSGEFGSWGPCEAETGPSAEVCENQIDDDCDGSVDEDCPEDCLKVVSINISGDCVTVDCPADAPYPVACAVNFVGDTPHGCVASTPTTSTVFFKEGVVCDAGYLVGSLTCSCQPGAGLDASNCSINKANKHYKGSAGECP